MLAGNAERAGGRLDAAARCFELMETEDEASPPPEPWMASERAKMLGSWHLERAEFGAALAAADPWLSAWRGATGALRIMARPAGDRPLRTLSILGLDSLVEAAVLPGGRTISR